MSWVESRVCHLLDLLSFVARLLPPGFPNLKNGGDRLWPSCLPVSSSLLEVTCVRKHVSHITISLSFCLQPRSVEFSNRVYVFMNLIINVIVNRMKIK